MFRSLRALQRLQNWPYYKFMPSHKRTHKRTTGLIHNSYHNSETENKLPIVMYNYQFTLSQNSFCMVLAKISSSSTWSYHTHPLTHHLKFLVPINLLFTALNVLVQAFVRWDGLMFIPTDTFFHSTAKCLLLALYIFPKIMTFHISSCGWQQMCVCKEPSYEMNQLSSNSITNTSYCDTVYSWI